LLQVSKTLEGGEIQKLVEPSQTKSIQVHQKKKEKQMELVSTHLTQHNSKAYHK
jgi:hypothetical protein